MVMDVLVSCERYIQNAKISFAISGVPFLRCARDEIAYAPPPL